jgi:hypothetical protein
MPASTESSPAAGLQPDASLEVCDTDSEYGLGVRTLAPRRKGQVIHHFTGVLTPELKQHSLQVSPGLHISETEIIGFLSHSCEPDCRLDMAQSELVALRDIRPGDLLTIDYAETEDVLYRQFACHCGAPRCRHWITGRIEQPNTEGRAHMATLAP